ncbi:hypothetical protein [Sutterella megalosphaeroides]|uniref:hypothetical protein n=1 Tax=Sutterella megalosphaeroides TaxID=2494234 RepID=UPI000F50B33A|nr:hypothetical protein [Sutterella megalosphaeroides]
MFSLSVLAATAALSAAAAMAALPALERELVSYARVRAVLAFVGLALLAHLAATAAAFGRPALLLNVLAHPASPVFRGVASSLAALAFLFPYARALASGDDLRRCRRLAALAGVAGCALAFAQASTQYMPWREAWASPAVILPEAGLCASGAVAVRAAFVRRPLSLREALLALSAPVGAALYALALGPESEPLRRLLSVELALPAATCIGLSIVTPLVALGPWLRRAPQHAEAAAAFAATAAAMGLTHATLAALGEAAWRFFG